MHAEPIQEARQGRRARLLWLLVLVAALLPSLGTLRAPWIAEDTTVLAQVAEEGAWADWNRPWFGMQIVRFWRPLVSLSWELQYATTGLDPLALRLFNLGLHAGCALLVFGCVRRLGGGALAALAAGLLAAWFPFQGGTVTWLSGRTDLLAGFFLLASVHAALGPRAWLAAPFAFLAAASKEFGFLAPLWCALLAWAVDGSLRASVKRALPATLAVALAFLWRRVALGTFGGGYAGELPGVGSTLSGIGLAVLDGGAPTTVALPFLVFWLFVLRGQPAARRALSGALCAYLCALALLVPLLADGQLEPENRRLLFVPWLAFALGFGVVLRAGSVLWPRGVLGVWLLVPLAQAWRDTHRWAGAAERSADRCERARLSAASLTSGDGPLLVPDLPTSVDGAYALGFGVAERFRAPFPISPRPVWPWRLLFVADPARERLPANVPQADGTLLPFDLGLAVPALALRAEGELVRSLVVDERCFLQGEDRSTPLELAGGPPDAPLELLVISEHGYEPFAAGALDAQGNARSTLRALLQLSNGVTPAILAVAQSSDLGARRAYLELRAVASDGQPLAATWLELTWSGELGRE